MRLFRYMLAALVAIAPAAPVAAQTAEGATTAETPALPGTDAERAAIMEELKEALFADTLPLIPQTNAAEGIGGGEADSFFDRLGAAQEAGITDRAFVLMGAVWPHSKIFVCWEELDPAFEKEREIVREAAMSQWDANSALEFIGWVQCVPESRGIRIAVKDEGPHTKGLGTQIDGVKEGMVLNFTYRNWSPACQNMSDYCTRVIAVHEFGHALAFAHEHNRPDRPITCRKPQQGTDGDRMVTPYDIHSVMDYCNPEYANNGELSDGDKQALREIYGG